MGDPISARKSHDTTLRNRFELEKRRLSYDNYHSEAMKTRSNLVLSPSIHTQKQSFRTKDEIVRHISSLPSYLESGKATPDRALSFGVMDYGRLEKWQYQNLKQGIIKSSKCSTSSSVSSSLFSSDASSSTQSTIGQRCSPAPRVTLQSHFNISNSGNLEKLQDFKDSEKKTSETKRKDYKTYNSCPPKIPESKSSMNMGNRQTNLSSLKGKMKIKNEEGNEPQDSVVSKTLQMEPESSRNQSSTSRSHVLEEKRSSFSSKISNLDSRKQRSMSPLRRFSFTMSSKSPISQKSTTGNTCVSNRSSSSPLRRLLEPLFPSKATNTHRETVAKVSGNCREAITDTKQALFQTAIKNGRPMFTFAVENSNALAATVRDLSKNNNTWIYTFFTIDEVKKKNGSWLSQSKKDKDYVPNVIARMKVSNRVVSNSNSNTREFVLFPVDKSQPNGQISNVQPRDELAAIVVKFSKVGDKEEKSEGFNTTVVLPGGNHGVSSKGRPTPLIERWITGGACDCGGWDLGCRLRTLTNEVESRRRSNATSGQFELFFQGDNVNERSFFSLCPLKEGIYSVEYNSSLSVLQAFSICISVVECRKSTQDTESRTYVAKQVEDDLNPLSFASFPPLSPVGRKYETLVAEVELLFLYERADFRKSQIFTNSLRFTLNQDPRVTLCGYSIPHPSEAKVNIRVQTTGDPAKEVLKDSCQDLMMICQHVRSTFEQAVADFKNNEDSESQ
ncbi:unnamed protein product [Lactuca saligna]|uniref:DNA-directed RNA polymerase RBP11-like dimerisation domain-containing protein n=1 Tax=Lactuca saligna TaxID=75948 RepID=A0AA35Y9Y2_LACSI|nr:unnamed protein product [Lactuca saligna]